MGEKTRSTREESNQSDLRKQRKEKTARHEDQVETQGNKEIS